MKEEVVLDSEAIGSIAKAVAETVLPAVDKKINEAMASKASEADEAKDKKITDLEAKMAAIEANEGVKSKDVSATESAINASKARAKVLIAFLKKDTEAVKAYNKGVIEAREKLGYANSDVNADGGYIVLDPEFEAEIEKLSPVYGVAFREANVRNINSNSIKTNKRGSNVVMYETGQGVAKTGTKLVINQITVELRKFAAIAVATDELVEDAAIDFWAEVADGFAEERARIADELIFTDDDATYPGILHTDGIAVETVGATISLITWDDLLNAEVAVPTRAMQNGKHYMHRTVWNIVRKSKDSQGRYQLMPEAGNVTPWGTPVVLVDVLPSASVVGDGNEGYTVFGDLKRARLYVKRGLVLDTSNEATVADANGNDVNLFEQDMTALRAVTRMVALIKFPEAFCVIGTGDVS